MMNILPKVLIEKIIRQLNFDNWGSLMEIVHEEFSEFSYVIPLCLDRELIGTIGIINCDLLSAQVMRHQGLEWNSGLKYIAVWKTRKVPSPLEFGQCCEPFHPRWPMLPYSQTQNDHKNEQVVHFYPYSHQ